MNSKQQLMNQELTITEQTSPSHRIAIVSDAISGRNGVGSYYLDLVDALEPFIEKIELIAPQMQPERNIEAFAFSLPGDKTQRMAVPKSNAISHRLDMIKPDIIILPAIGAFTHVAYRYARRNRIKIIVANHTNFEQLLSLYAPRFFVPALRYLLAKLMKGLYSKADGIVVVDEENLNDTNLPKKRPIRLLGTPLDRNFLSHPPESTKAQISRVIFVGRLAPEKAIDKILDAANALPDIQFDIVGEGPLRQSLASANETLPNLKLWGWLERREVRELIDAADVLVLPSEFETFGTVALEALARRRFVVVSENCGISRWPELAKGLFTIEQSRTLAQKLMELCEMPPQKREQHAQKSWSAVDRFQDDVVKTWLNFINEIGSKDEGER